MTALACILARGDHPTRCARCRAAAAQDRAVRALAEKLPMPPLSPRARDRALAAALAAPPVAAPVRWTRVLVPAGVALAAAAAIVLVLATRGGDHPAPPAIAQAPNDAPMPSETTLAVGHGTVRAERGAVAWKVSDREVLLLSGHLDVEVDAAVRQQFRVRTGAFVVDVLGTVFRVGTDGVVVSRGVVRVTSTTGTVLVDRLTAGERWELPPLALAPEPDPEPEPDSIAVAAEMEFEPEKVGTPRKPGRSAAETDKLATEQVKSARTLTVGGDYGAARAEIKRALALKPSRHVRVDAELLLADTYNRAGDRVTAINMMVGISERYRDLADGAAALFTAARWAEKASDKAEARRLYQLYVDRYPSGTLGGHARARLRALEKP